MDAVINEVPPSPPKGKPGWTAPQIARLVGAHPTTVTRWIAGITINGRHLKLSMSVDGRRPHLGQFATPQELSRFLAAYKAAKKSPRRPRKNAAAAPLAGAA